MLSKRRLWLISTVIFAATAFDGSSAVGQDVVSETATSSEPASALGIFTDICSIVGFVLGTIAIGWNVLRARLQYLHVDLTLSTVDAFVLAGTRVENKGARPKVIEYALLLVGPEAEDPVTTASILLPTQNIRYTNDLEAIGIQDAAYDDKGRAIIPVPFYYSENVDIADERIGYEVPIPTAKVDRGVPIAVRFYVFGENRLHRSTERTFVMSDAAHH